MNKQDLKKVKDNSVLGQLPELINSSITFKGKNNILYCENDVVLENCDIVFHGDNSVIYLSKSFRKYRIKVSIHNNSFIYIGRNCYMNNALNIVLSEEKNLFIGDDCFFSTGITFRNADPHLIYDEYSYKRINPTKSIYIGDHVWIGQDVIVLKGSLVDSGSVIGAYSLLSNKHIEHNTSNGGNPIRLIRKHIFWSNECVHSWTKKDTVEHNVKKTKKYLYKYNKKECIDYLTIDKEMSNRNPEEKVSYLSELVKSKNRFVHKKKHKSKLVNKTKYRLKTLRSILGKIKRRIIK